MDTVTLSTAVRGGPAASRPEVERYGLVAILELIRTGRATTRSALERSSSFGRAVIVDRLATLSRLGLVEEGATAPSMGGRAPRTIRLRTEAGLILVANLDRTTISVGLADLAGRIVFEHHEAADIAEDPEPVIGRLTALIDWVLDQQQPARPLWGIGIGVPGAVERRTDGVFGLPRLNFSPSWSRSRAVERLIARHGAPVWVRSAFQMAAMGELGPPRPSRATSLLFVALGTELSAALIADGRLQDGALGIAGQIGHIWAGPDHRFVCRCGNVGCLETVAGSAAVIGAAIDAAGTGGRLSNLLAERGAIGVADIGFAAQLGDAASAEILARAGRLVGTTLAAVVNTTNPAEIVLGGELSQTGDILLAAIREAIYRHSHPLATRDLRIVRSNMGRSAGLAGAALVAVDALFAPALLGEWIGLGSPLRHPGMAALTAQAIASLAA